METSHQRQSRKQMIDLWKMTGGWLEVNLENVINWRGLGTNVTDWQQWLSQSRNAIMIQANVRPTQKFHTNHYSHILTVLVDMNETKTALGRVHLPPTKMFPWLMMNKTISKPCLAAATGAHYLYVGLSRRNKIPRCSNPVPASRL